MESNDRVVLVVEDDPECSAVLRQIVTLRGHRAIEASDGAVAAALIEAGLQPRLILLDYVMPRMDGRAFMEWLRQDPGRHAIPVVLMTGQQVTMAEAQALGCQERLTKPIDLRVLLTTLSRWGSAASA